MTSPWLPSSSTWETLSLGDVKFHSSRSSEEAGLQMASRMEVAAGAQD